MPTLPVPGLPGHPPWRRALRRDCLREVCWTLKRAREAHALGEFRYAVRLLGDARHDLGFGAACFGPSMVASLLRRIAMAIEDEIALALASARRGPEGA